MAGQRGGKSTVGGDAEPAAAGRPGVAKPWQTLCLIVLLSGCRPWQVAQRASSQKSKAPAPRGVSVRLPATARRPCTAPQVRGCMQPHPQRASECGSCWHS